MDVSEVLSVSIGIAGLVFGVVQWAKAQKLEKSMHFRDTLISIERLKVKVATVPVMVEHAKRSKVAVYSEVGKTFKNQARYDDFLKRAQDAESRINRANAEDFSNYSSSELVELSAELALLHDAVDFILKQIEESIKDDDETRKELRGQPASR